MADSIKRNLIRIYEIMANKGCENLHVVLLLVSKEKMRHYRLGKLAK